MRSRLSVHSLLVAATGLLLAAVVAPVSFADGATSAGSSARLAEVAPSTLLVHAEQALGAAFQAEVSATHASSSLIQIKDLTAAIGDRAAAIREVTKAVGAHPLDTSASSSSSRGVKHIPEHPYNEVNMGNSASGIEVASLEDLLAAATAAERAAIQEIRLSRHTCRTKTNVKQLEQAVLDSQIAVTENQRAIKDLSRNAEASPHSSPNLSWHGPNNPYNCLFLPESSICCESDTNSLCASTPSLP